MARTSNKTASVADEAVQAQDPEVTKQLNDQTQEVKDVQETECGKKSEENIPSDVLALMKLYPQYEEFYVTPKGFVHPAGVPEYLRKGATLYKNRFFNK